MSTPPLPRLLLDVACRTHRGLVRDRNEDSVLVTPLAAGRGPDEPAEGLLEVGRDGALFAICDGMGGSAGGDVASRLTAEVVARALARAPDPQEGGRALPERLREALEEASASVHLLASERRELTGMGTTATVCAVREAELLLAHVGDSRAYLLRAGRLTQLTRDQSLATHLLESGQLTPEEVASCGFRHVILQAVGGADRLQVDLRSVALRRGDVLLFCSDGLWDVVAHEAIATTLAEATSAAAACDDLVRLALEQGGPDNVTCIVARAEGAALEPPTADEIPVARPVAFDPNARSAHSPDPSEARASSVSVPADQRPTRPSTSGLLGAPIARLRSMLGRRSS